MSAFRSRRTMLWMVGLFAFTTAFAFGYQQASATLCYCNCSTAWCEWSNGGLGGYIEGTLSNCYNPLSNCEIDFIRCQGCYPY